MNRWTLNESTPVVVGADRSASWSLQQLYVLALRTAISTTTAYLACTRYRAKKGGLLGELRVLLCRAGYIQPLCHQTGNSFRLFAPAWSLWSLTSSVVPMHSANLHATLQGGETGGQLPRDPIRTGRRCLRFSVDAATAVCYDGIGGLHDVHGERFLSKELQNFRSIITAPLGFQCTLKPTKTVYSNKPFEGRTPTVLYVVYRYAQ